ncbi:purine/pyrimidine permease [Prosthecochloris sp. N3]|uniref:Purine/pyrimidine permease n=1 Tax=Prosthecochloris ethylica TaxID=2743976 RepID=A0ABR9XTG0_9CHLB|nr:MULTISPECIES: solute carrier family 23 protein [Prosthecochloris]MEC9486844.1 solute carrier family 23 protein [Prosthecochloris sp.]MBF0585949.1 purine/pyrimidine permease [Prosthecochloris ethylica]MBF0637046.1 purine/pyrimidine permease [Prosthecochloris ethylica]NUK47283.1 purine/pyrimidine permease [Prosthecochloris ethylica]RNA64078.1 xanthine permease [Prosthecochloris sp. ZM_2]
MAEQKKALEYRFDEMPPAGHLLMLSLQHVMLMFVSVGLPIIFTSQINESSQFAATLVALSMLAAGLGSIIQSAGLPFIGSGYLCPNVCGPSYLSLSLSAAWAGGIPLMRGMIILAGLVEMALAPMVHKLKTVFPGFIVGLVVAMVGISVIRMSVTSLFGLEFRGDAIRSADIAIGMASLLVMVLCNIWGKGFVRIYCLLIGMVAGWGLALAVEPEYRHALALVRESEMFALPSPGAAFSGIQFRLDMVIPFVVIAVSGSLKSFGNLLAAQKLSEPEREQVDYTPVRKGLLADGLSTALAGLIGGMAVDTSSSNIGLAGSTRVLSRWISVVAGVLFILLAFCPKVTMALSLMPKPVLGASIIFAGCFMISTGFLEMFSDEWDARKTFSVGIALFFGLSTAFLPALYARAPELIRTFFTDPLPTTTILAVVLNQLFTLDRTAAAFLRRFRSTD